MTTYRVEMLVSVLDDLETNPRALVISKTPEQWTSQEFTYAIHHGLVNMNTIGLLRFEREQ